MLEPLEDPGDYEVFEQSIMADYDATSAVERALVVRIAGLLWRLRRAALIETGLLQNELDQESHHRSRLTFPAPKKLVEISHSSCFSDQLSSINEEIGVEMVSSGFHSINMSQCFRKLLSCDKGAFELLGRYEGSLWRQLRQTLYVLERIKHRPVVSRRRPRFSWGAERAKPFEDDQLL